MRRCPFDLRGSPRAIAIAAVLYAVTATAAPAAPGDLDRSFGRGGEVALGLEPGSNDGANAVALQADGKIVAVGSTQAFDPAEEGAALEFAIVRVNADGSRDTSFEAPISADGITPAIAPGIATGVAIQPDGRIVVVGSTFTGEQRSDFGVLRLLPDGRPDPSFAGDGFVTASFGEQSSDDQPAAVALQPDGRILVAGRAGPSAGGHVALARFNNDGSLDTTFDGDGLLITEIPDNHSAGSDVELKPDGGFVLVGSTLPVGRRTDRFLVAAYDASGALDQLFSQDGLFTGAFGRGGSAAVAVELTADGRIIVSGEVGALSDAPGIGLARLTPTGTFDAAFGTGGTSSVSFGAEYPTDMFLQPDGKIVTIQESPLDGIARFNPGGRVDGTFRRRVGGALTAGVLQPNGRIVAVGTTEGEDDDDFLLLRVRGGADRRRPRISLRGLPQRRCTFTRFALRVNIREPSTLRSATVWLDGRRIRKTKRKRFRQPIPVPRLRSGRHRLEVRVIDAGGNRARRSARFQRC